MFLFNSLNLLRASESNKYLFSANIGLDSKVILKSGYDPYDSLWMNDFTASESILNINSGLDFQYINNIFISNGSFSLSKNLLSFTSVKSVFDAFEISDLDSEHENLSYTSYLVNFSFFLKVSDFIKCGLSFGTQAELSRFNFPYYVDLDTQTGVKRSNHIYLYPKVSVQSKYGELMVMSLFEQKNENVDKKVSQSFNFDQNFSISYGIFYESVKFVKKLIRVELGFINYNIIFDDPFYDVHKMIVSSKLNFYFGKTFTLFIKPVATINDYTFDRETIDSFEFGFLISLSGSQQITLGYNFEKSTFLNRIDHSYLLQDISLTYTLSFKKTNFSNQS